MDGHDVLRTWHCGFPRNYQSVCGCKTSVGEMFRSDDQSQFSARTGVQWALPGTLALKDLLLLGTPGVLQPMTLHYLPLH